jgi:hypothetical protein
LISQTPYINISVTTPQKSKAAKKPTRCPLTLDFLEDRADSERPYLRIYSHSLV